MAWALLYHSFWRRVFIAWRMSSAAVSARSDPCCYTETTLREKHCFFTTSSKFSFRTAFSEELEVCDQ